MISTLKWLEYLYLTNTLFRFYDLDRFDEMLLSARLDFVCSGAL